MLSLPTSEVRSPTLTYSEGPDPSAAQDSGAAADKKQDGRSAGQSKGRFFGMGPLGLPAYDWIRVQRDAGNHVIKLLRRIIRLPLGRRRRWQRAAHHKYSQYDRVNLAGCPLLTIAILCC